MNEGARGVEVDVPARAEGVERHRRWGYRAREFLRRLVDKSFEDEIFFMAGAIAFNLLVAVLPLLILGIGVAGYVLTARSGDPTAAILEMIGTNLPSGTAGVDIARALDRWVSVLMAQRSGFTFFGGLIFVWLATRLAATLRISLREIFDVGPPRGIVEGKLFDVKVVVAGVVLLTVNLGLTVAATRTVQQGLGALGATDLVLSLAERLLANGLAFVSIWTLFFIIYRYVPARRIPWLTSVIAATFAAVLHEVLKHAFSWYATSVADYGSTFGNLATAVALIAWIYYGSVVFILGGEVAQVYTMRSATRVRAVPGPAR